MKTSSSKFCFVLSSVVALAFALTPAAGGGGAPPPPPHSGPFALTPGPSGFGAQGQLVIGGALEAPINSGGTNTRPMLGIAKTSGGDTIISIQPSLDYFIIPNVSVGGVVGLTVVTGRPGRTTVLLGARGGYNLNLADRVSFWPTLGLSFEHTSVGNGGGSDQQTYLNILAPFLFHLAPHFFVGAGPFIDVGLGAFDPNLFGIWSVVGGWI
jgi:hypothetical protein